MKKETPHRQFNKISLCFSPTAKEKNRLIALRAISRICGMNRRLVAERLEIDFKKPFNLLAKMPAEARGPAQQQAVCGVNSAPSEAANSIWWTLADSNRRPPHCPEKQGVINDYVFRDPVDNEASMNMETLVVNFRKSQNPFSRKSRRRLLIISARAGKKEGGWGEGIFARPRFSAATEFRAPQSGVCR